SIASTSPFGNPSEHDFLFQSLTGLAFLNTPGGGVATVPLPKSLALFGFSLFGIGIPQLFRRTRVMLQNSRRPCGNS
ncbi:hypothetical protein, partial [Lichenifustis flavocetrariae]